MEYMMLIKLLDKLFDYTNRKTALKVAPIYAQELRSIAGVVRVTRGAIYRSVAINQGVKLNEAQLNHVMKFVQIELNCVINNNCLWVDNVPKKPRAKFLGVF